MFSFPISKSLDGLVYRFIDFFENERGCILETNFYWPQLRKVMFLHLSVILFTGGALSHTPGRHPPGQTPPCAVHAGIRSTSGRYASYWNAILLTRFSPRFLTPPSADSVINL